MHGVRVYMGTKIKTLTTLNPPFVLEVIEKDDAYIHLLMGAIVLQNQIVTPAL